VPESLLPYATIAELARQIRLGAVSPVDLVEYFLKRIARLDGTLHALTQLTQERALEEAAAAEALLKTGHDLGPLHGIPYLAKDLFDIKDCATTAGTRLRNDHVAQADCTVVARLSAAGMVLLGKTQASQLAMSPAGVNHDVGTPFNPWHREHYVPGGSSSGSAVAVAAGLVPMALGTDTCSSVRGPASLCGIVGLKPTVGRISRSGVFPLSSTLDSPGPLTRSVADAALVYQAVQGFDKNDLATARLPTTSVVEYLGEGIEGYRLGIGETVFFDNVDVEVESAVRGTSDVFDSLGATVKNIDIPEVAAAHEIPNRFDFVTVEGYSFNKMLLEEHPTELDPLVLGLSRGKEIPATAYVELSKAQSTLREQLNDRLQEVDAVLVPATHAPALPLAIVDANVDSHWDCANAYLRNTFLGTFLGLCSVSVPCGFTEGGLPIGLLVYAKSFEEDVALRVAHAFEQATEWHLRHPNLSWVNEGARPR